MKFEEVVLSLLPFTHLEEGTRSMSFGGWYTLSATEQISSFFVILLVTLYMFTVPSKKVWVSIHLNIPKFTINH